MIIILINFPKFIYINGTNITIEGEFNMDTVKIPLKDTIIKKMKGKTLVNWNINSNGELELELEECQLFDRLEKLDKELDEGKGITLSVDEFEKRYL